MAKKRRRSRQRSREPRERLYVGSSPVRTREEMLASEARIVPWAIALCYFVAVSHLLDALLESVSARPVRAFGPPVGALLVALFVGRHGRRWPIFATVLIVGTLGFVLVVALVSRWNAAG